MSDFLKSIHPKQYLYVLLVVCVVVYYPVLNNGFILYYDDLLQIVNNTSIHTLSWENIKTYFTTAVAESYQPLASLSFALEYAISGDSPFLYHLTNLVLHLLNVFLVFVLLRKFGFFNDIQALFVTALFALHPLQVETVACISVRSTLLFTLFLLLSSLKYLYFIRYNTRKEYLLSLLFFTLAVFSKSAAIIFPLLLLLYYWTFTKKQNWTKIAIYVLPFFILSILIGLYSIETRVYGEDLKKVLSYNFYDKILVSCYSLLFYIYKFILPIDLYYIYGHPIKYAYNNFTFPLPFYLAPFILIAISIGAIYTIKKIKPIKKQFLFGLLFFLINLSLILNIVAYFYSITAERYMYFAIIGLSIVFVLPITYFLKQQRQQKIGYGILLCILILCSLKSRSQTYIWKDDFTLYKYITDNYIKKNIEDNSAVSGYILMHNLYLKKNTMRKEEREKKAIEMLSNVIKFKKDYPTYYLYRGTALLNAGNYSEAIKDFDSILNSKIILYHPPTRLSAFKERAKIRALAGIQLKDVMYSTLALQDIDSVLYYEKNNTGVLQLKKEVEENINLLGSSSK